MPDLLWDDVREFFDPDLMGALPDVCVADTSVEDWQAVFDLVRSSGWAWEYTEGGVIMPLPTAARVFSRPVGSAVVDLRVRPAPDMLMIFRPYGPGEVDVDVDLRELQGQERVNLLCDVMAAIGRRLGKRVLLTPEGDSENPVFGFDPVADRVLLLARP